MNKPEVPMNVPTKVNTLMEKKRIGDHVEDAIGNHSLQDTSAALAEVALDSAIEEGVFRDIPILGSILGIGRATASIRDRIFANKLAYFLKEIGSVPTNQRKNLIDEINSREDVKVKVGEKILYIVDRCEDHESSRAAGVAFKAFLEERIDYSEFVAIAFAIDRLPYPDIIRFLKESRERIPAWEANMYFGTGLVEFDELEISVEDQWDRKASNAYVVSGNDLTVSATNIGLKMREILSDLSS